MTAVSELENVKQDLENQVESLKEAENEGMEKLQKAEAKNEELQKELEKLRQKVKEGVISTETLASLSKKLDHAMNENKKLQVSGFQKSVSLEEVIKVTSFRKTWVSSKN